LTTGNKPTLHAQVWMACSVGLVGMAELVEPMYRAQNVSVVIPCGHWIA